VAPLRGKIILYSPVGQARSEALVQNSMEDLQPRSAAPDVPIHGLPGGVIGALEVVGGETDEDMRNRLPLLNRRVHVGDDA